MKEVKAPLVGELSLSKNPCHCEPVRLSGVAIRFSKKSVFAYFLGKTYTFRNGFPRRFAPRNDTHFRKRYFFDTLRKHHRWVVFSLVAEAGLEFGTVFDFYNKSYQYNVKHYSFRNFSMPFYATVYHPLVPP